MSISFFAKHWFWGQGQGRSDNLYTIRVSSRIRGEEIAEYLGAKFNPKDDYENDICIYLKPRRLNNIKDSACVDVLDCPELVPLLKARPKIRVIAMSEAHYEFLRAELENEIFLIPHHHINLERIMRNKNKILVGGYVGPPSDITYKVYEDIKKQLEETGTEFMTCYNYKTRQDIIDFYKKIDFQVVWFHDFFDKNSPFRHPTKMINAASFGIPTIANRIAGYKEFEGYYIPLDSKVLLVKEVEKLREEYDKWSNMVFEEAEKYHISKTSQLYLKL